MTVLQVVQGIHIEGGWCRKGTSDPKFEPQYQTLNYLFAQWRKPSTKQKDNQLNGRRYSQIVHQIGLNIKNTEGTHKLNTKGQTIQLKNEQWT